MLAGWPRLDPDATAATGIHYQVSAIGEVVRLFTAKVPENCSFVYSSFFVLQDHLVFLSGK